MNSTTSENPYRVLLGSSFTLFLSYCFGVLLAFLGVLLYVAVSGVAVPIQVSPSASVWELQLKPEQSASNEHENLAEELIEALPVAAFELEKRENETWLIVHARTLEVFQSARRLVDERGYDTGKLRLPSSLDMFSSRSLQASLAWLGEHPVALMTATSGPVVSFLLFGLILTSMARRRNFVWVTGRPSVGRRITEGLVGGVVLVAAAFLVERLCAVAGRPVVELAWVTKVLESGGAANWMFWGLAVIVAPVAEELFFRGYVFQSLDVRLSTPVALVVSTTYFAGVHGNPSGLFVYLTLGVGLGYLHWRTRSLLAPILAHSLVNAAALLS